MVVASGIMAYYYQGDKQVNTDTKEGQVAGKVKAASGQWNSEWTVDQYSGFIPDYTRVNNFNENWSEDEKYDELLEAKRVVETYLAGTDPRGLKLGDYSTRKPLHLWGFPPLVQEWQVAGEVGNESFNENWSLSKLQCPIHYEVTGSKKHSHTGVLITGNVRLDSDSGRLLYEYYAGTEHLAGNNRISTQGWLHPFQERREPIEYPNVTYQDNRLNLPWDWLLGSTTPVGWQITGSFN